MYSNCFLTSLHLVGRWDEQAIQSRKLPWRYREWWELLVVDVGSRCPEASDPSIWGSIPVRILILRGEILQSIADILLVVDWHYCWYIGRYRDIPSIVDLTCRPHQAVDLLAVQFRDAQIWSSNWSPQEVLPTTLPISRHQLFPVFAGHDGWWSCFPLVDEW